MILAGFLGLMMGGFLNSFAYRIEKSKDIFAPIHCRHCHQRLIWIDIIPVLSWIIFKAKCRYCHGHLSFIYPLVELSMMTYGVLLYAFVPIINLNMGLLFGLGFTSVAMSLVDIRAYRLPNNLMVFLGLLGMVWCFHEPTQAMIDACVLAGIGGILKYSFETILKTPSLGWGDVKLMAISGLWIETVDIPVYLILAGFLGVLSGVIWEKRMKSKIFPFAPALSVALLLTVWWRLLI